MARKLFCEYGPAFYAVSLAKERALRRLRDWRSGAVFAAVRLEEELPHVIMGHRSLLRRQLAGIDPLLQENKITNLRLACAPMDGLLIPPGETFSFWRLAGEPTARRGFLPGLTLSGGQLGADVGGGLCQLANLIHWLVLHSPLTVTELHHHTDAIFPDAGRRVPFGTGTSVFYNNVDYRFRNDTPQVFQLRVWLDDTDLWGELRCDAPLPLRYRIREEDHHYRREADGWYRCSRVWQEVTSRETGELLSRTLVLENHSRVLFDPALIPPDQVRETQEETAHGTAQAHR